MRRTFSFAAGIALALLVLVRAIDPVPVAALREAYFDTLQRIAPRKAHDLPVRVVDIDEASLRDLGQWPWPRHILADLTDQLTDLGAAVIAFDLLFAEPDRLSPSRHLTDDGMFQALPPELREVFVSADNDLIFSRSLGRSFPVLGIAASDERGDVASVRAGFVSVGDAPTALLPPLPTVTPVVPQLADAALGFGVLNVSPDGIDGTVRRVPMLWSGRAGPVPGLALEALRVALGESTVVLMGLEGGQGLERVRVGEFDIPTNDRGEFRVHYRPFDPDMFVSAAELLSDDVQPETADKISGHIVFVGTSAAGLLDIRSTPLGETVPGVSIHAQIIEQILSEDYLLRADITSGAEMLALLVTGLVVSGVMILGGAVASILAGGVAAMAVGGFSILAFVQSGVLFDATFPLIGGFVAFSTLAMFQFVVVDREKRMIRRSFSRYVSEDVLSEIEARGHSLELGGEIREVTVLFSDIRGFTELSESLDAQALVGLLNDLFTRLTKRILDRRGTIDKYIGDSVMAFWNAPIAVPDHTEQACHAALEMRVALKAFNAERVKAGETPVDVMIGLAAGAACVGNIGSNARFNYSVVGDTVNRAARIEASCRHVDFDLVVSTEVAAAAPDMAVLSAGSLDLKGVSERKAAFLLVGDKVTAAEPAFHRLSEAHDTLITLLQRHDDPTKQIETCMVLATDVDTRLAAFYSKVSERADDFRV